MLISAQELSGRLSNSLFFIYIPSNDSSFQIKWILAINSINRSLYILFPYWPVFLKNLIFKQSYKVRFPPLKCFENTQSPISADFLRAHPVPVLLQLGLFYWFLFIVLFLLIHPFLPDYSYCDNSYQVIPELTILINFFIPIMKSLHTK